MPDPYIEPSIGLFYSDVWNDESSRVRHRDRLRVSRGVEAEGGRSAPTSMQFSLDNTDGRFSVANPSSTLNGLLGRNNPVRAYLGTPHPGASNAEPDLQPTAHVAPSVEAPTDDGLLLCAWATPVGAGGGTYTLPGSMTLVDATGGGDLGGAIGAGQLLVGREDIGSAGATGTRTATLSTGAEFVAASVLLHGTSPAVAAVDTAQQIDPRVELTGVDVGDWLVLVAYHGWHPVGEESLAAPAYPSDLVESGWTRLADTGTLQPNAQEATLFRLAVWARRVRRAGDVSVRVDPAGRTLISLIRVTGVGDWTLRGHAELVSMPPRRDLSGNDRWVPVEAAGVLRRLGASTAEPLEDSIHRFMRPRGAIVENPIAYFPLSDGEGTVNPVSGLDDGAVMRFGGNTVTGAGDITDARPSFGAGFLGSWLPPAAELRGEDRGDTGSSAGGELTGPCRSGTPSAPHTVAVEMMLRVTHPSDFGDQPVRLHLSVITASNIRYGAIVNQSDWEWRVLAHNIESDTFDSSADLPDVKQTLLDEQPHHMRLSLTNGGGATEVDWTLTLDQNTVGTGTLDVGGPTGISAPVKVSLTYSTAIGVSFRLTTPVHVGQLAAWTAANSFDLNRFSLTQTLAAAFGHDGEPAGRRILRLCQEESVAAAAVGDPDSTVMMGPQRTATLLDLLRECEDVDRGILHEPREFVGLAYRTVGSLYNQDPVATLDFTAGNVAAPWEPTPDDRLIRNDVTVTRQGGGSARSVQESGPLNVADPGSGDPEAVGRYRHDPTLNVANDVQTPSLARWVKLLGTQDEARFPSIAANLLREQVLSLDADLVAALAGLDVGDKIVIQNPAPGDLPPDDVEQLWVGSDELLSQVDWDLAGNTVPAAPYTAGVVEDEVLGVLQSDSARRIDSPIDETQTGITIFCGAGPDWTYEADFDLLVGGERWTVTAVGSPAGTFPDRSQLLTVTRSVNGVVKEHPAGIAVRFAPQVYIGL